MAGEFAGKVVVITGAGGNLGGAVARRFGREGAKLALVNRSIAGLDTLGDELGVEALPVATDVTSEAEVDAMVEQVVDRFGRIDVLAHTVGGFGSGKRVYEPGLDVLDKMWNLNVRPVYIVCGRVARHMVEREIAGKITVVVARSALRGGAGVAAYTASKAASLRIVESLALEVRDRGIHVNAVSPSTMDTPQNRADMPNADPAKWVTVEQVADAIAFLSSEAGAAFYGANLEVYGRA